MRLRHNYFAVQKYLARLHKNTFKRWRSIRPFRMLCGRHTKRSKKHQSYNFLCTICIGKRWRKHSFVRSAHILYHEWPFQMTETKLGLCSNIYSPACRSKLVSKAYADLHKHSKQHSKRQSLHNGATVGYHKRFTSHQRNHTQPITVNNYYPLFCFTASTL